MAASRGYRIIGGRWQGAIGWVGLSSDTWSGRDKAREESMQWRDKIKGLSCGKGTGIREL